MYYFNSLLFENLYRLSGMNSTSFSNSYFGNHTKYAKRCGNPAIMPINELIGICNAMRISIGHFITTTEYAPFLKERSKYIINEAAFKPIGMRPDALRNLSPYIDTGGKRLSVNKLADLLEMNKATLCFWMKNQENIKTGEIINLCNKLKCDLDVLFDDPNDTLPPNTTKADDYESPNYGFELADLRNKLLLQQAELNALKAENKQIKGLSTEPVQSAAAIRQRQWTVNYRLILSLPKQADEEGKGLLTANEARTGDLTMTRLIELCNRLHISTKNIFVRTDEEIPLYPYGKYQPDNEEWITIVWHPEYIRELYGRGSVTGMSLAEIAEMEGLSETKMQNWRKRVSEMHMSDFATLLNKLDITPNCLIEDRNKPGVDYGTTVNELLIAENRMLRQHLFRLWKQIKANKS